jgi:predicted alpha/beta superfamily hydrolase
MKIPMFRRSLLAALVLTAGASVPCAADTISGGERLTLSSKILGEERTVFVSLPASYGRGAQRYPVLYMTDAQINFSHVRTSADFLARNGFMPEIIIVGVVNVDRTRDLYASRADFKANGRTIPFPNSGNADRFLAFIEDELIPWAESRYRAVPLRILAGVSAGGNFAFHAMRVKPALFQAVLAASPWLAWDDRKELKMLAPFLSSAQVKTRALFFSSANEGPEMRGNLDEVTRALKARRAASLRWSSAAYPLETHDSTALKAFYDGLRWIFAEWEFPRDPATNALKGSLDDVKAHYAKFGESFGVALLTPEVVVNELGYQQLRAAQVEASVATFRYNTELYPESPNVWDSLADGLERAGRMDEALASCRKAVSLGETQGDPNIETFRKHTARLAGPAKPDTK